MCANLRRIFACLTSFERALRFRFFHENIFSAASRDSFEHFLRHRDARRDRSRAHKKSLDARKTHLSARAQTRARRSRCLKARRALEFRAHKNAWNTNTAFLHRSRTRLCERDRGSLDAIMGFLESPRFLGHDSPAFVLHATLRIICLSHHSPYTPPHDRPRPAARRRRRRRSRAIARARDRVVKLARARAMLDFMPPIARADAFALPPRKRLAAALRACAHSPADFGSKKSRIAGDSYVTHAMRALEGSTSDARRHKGTAMNATRTTSNATSDDDVGANATTTTTTTTTGEDANGMNAGTTTRAKDASASDLTTQTTERKKKNRGNGTMSIRASDSDGDGNEDVAEERRELSDEALALQLHMQMNASPRASRGSRQSSQMIGKALFN